MEKEAGGQRMQQSLEAGKGKDMRLPYSLQKEISPADTLILGRVAPDGT